MHIEVLGKWVGLMIMGLKSEAKERCLVYIRSCFYYHTLSDVIVTIVPLNMLGDHMLPYPLMRTSASIKGSLYVLVILMVFRMLTFHTINNPP